MRARPLDLWLMPLECPRDRLTEAIAYNRCTRDDDQTGELTVVVPPLGVVGVGKRLSRRQQKPKPSLHVQETAIGLGAAVLEHLLALSGIPISLVIELGSHRLGLLAHSQVACSDSGHTGDCCRQDRGYVHMRRIGSAEPRTWGFRM